jgi:glycosyltransferase involved in cell wall biosynthesis
MTEDVIVANMMEQTLGHRAEVVHFGPVLESCVAPPSVESPRILFSDQLDQGSGIAYLVRALPYILREADAKLVLMGNGVLAPFVKQLIQLLRIEHAVEWNSSPSRRDFQREFAACHVYVSPRAAFSEDGGVGIPPGVLEAYACGKPVVGTRFASHADLVRNGQSGWLIEPADEYGLAKRVLDLIQHRQRGARFGEAGQARLHHDHDWSAGMSRLEKLYVQAMTREMQQATLQA